MLSTKNKLFIAHVVLIHTHVEILASDTEVSQCVTICVLVGMGVVGGGGVCLFVGEDLSTNENIHIQ